MCVHVFVCLCTYAVCKGQMLRSCVFNCSLPYEAASLPERQAHTFDQIGWLGPPSDPWSQPSQCWNFRFVLVHLSSFQGSLGGDT